MHAARPSGRHSPPNRVRRIQFTGRPPPTLGKENRVSRHPRTGPLNTNIRRAILFAIIVLVFLLLLFSQSILPPDGFAHRAIANFGILLIFVGILGRLWATLYIGGRKTYEIIAVGPYSIVRNPLYLFSTIAAFGVGAQTGSLTIMAFLGLLFFVAFHIVILKEERFLLGIHGAAYEAYLRQVPRFIPKPSLYRESEVREFSPGQMKRTLLDGMVFFLALPAMHIISFAQEAGVIPVLFRFP